MPAIGQRNRLKVLQETASGLYLDGGNLGQILLPGQYIPKGTRPGDKLDVFLYRDSEDRLVATTETPKAQVGEFALLEVISAHPRMGAFLDWGLSKDLLLPLREQARRVVVGDWVIAYVFLDSQTGRIVSSTRLNRYLGLVAPDYAEGQAVQIIVVDETPLGYKAIVENAHWGLVYHSDLNAPLRIGQRLQAYVRTVRQEDGKIDLLLTAPGVRPIVPLKEKIMEALQANGGVLAFDDKSEPQAIRDAFGTSKKAFKQALGALFKERLIRFTDKGIERV